MVGLGVGVWLQAVLFTLLAWAALLCTGLGGTVGVASQSLGNKPAANAQQLQRHAGTSLTSRDVRRDQAAPPAVRQIADDARAVVLGSTDGALPAGGVTQRIDAQRADQPPPSATEPGPAHTRAARHRYWLHALHAPAGSALRPLPEVVAPLMPWPAGSL